MTIFERDPGYTMERQPHAVSVDPDAELQRIIELNEGPALSKEQIRELLELRSLENHLPTEAEERLADLYRTSEDRDPAFREY